MAPAWDSLVIVVRFVSRFDAGSPDSATHREQDFGYEVIEQDEPPPMQHFDKVPEQFQEDLRQIHQQQEQQEVLRVTQVSWICGTLEK